MDSEGSMKLLTYGDSSEQISVDVGAHFSTNRSFCSKDEMVDWVRQIGKGLGFVVIITKADKIDSRAHPRVMLGCDRAGFLRKTQNKGFVKQNLRKSSSKRCGCKFSIRGRRESVEEWKVDVICGVHNHELVHLEAHAYAGRLDGSEVAVVEDMFNAGVKPRKILSALKSRNPSSCTTIRAIYNENAKIYRQELAGSTPIQYLYKCIGEAGYTSYNEVNVHTRHLESVFFAHPTAVKLSNLFPNTFLIDCTYKTNRYRLPLLSIVGITSTNQTFFSSFAFLSNETEGSYRWALQCFKNIFNENIMPNVFVTDREIALLNALKLVFPQAKQILCRVHISRNILAHCKKFFKSGRDFENFLGVWQHLVVSETENEYNIRFNQMVTNYVVKYPAVIAYVTSTWLDPYKEYFVSFWINMYLHFGNTSTNRVEGGHSVLKKFLEVSIGSLSTVWKAFHQMILLQHTEIKKMFGQSQIQVSIAFKSLLYSELLGNVSIAALEIIKKEELSLKDAFVEQHMCRHKTRYTLGLPCAHELIPYLKQCSPYPLALIHKHWRVLGLNGTEEKVRPNDASPVETHEPNDLEGELDGLLRRYKSISDLQRKEMKNKIREIVNPPISQTLEPKLPAKLKGRPKGSWKKFTDDYKSTKREPSHFEHVLMLEQKTSLKKVARKVWRSRGLNFIEKVRNQMPPNISSHIVDATDVIGDGHCGFRVLSAEIYRNNNWSQVRNDLARELQQHEVLYTTMFGMARRVELLNSLDCQVTPAPLEKWMSMPDMGLVIASCYNVQVVHVSFNQSFTFLPLHTAPPENRKLICFGFINGNHYIHLRLDEECELPRVFPLWPTYHTDVAEQWDIPFVTRL